ncbi:thermonuclease family protein [Rhizobium sp. RU36D]|uniref:thermonuclease family protein n=1 Tax=Rhizobium sp. RU36D TaxID=1907415 RepID=UPI0009D7C1C3|nr:thermonuclease family protein [Rhizobium sp. RU36D]SMC89099.1 nuclease homologue [Rhizobium sp. RU36D]
MFARSLAAIAIFALVPLTAAAAEAASRHIAGPVAADLIRVIDGDTLLVSAAPWPDHRVTTYVRLRGIDAPELKSKCPSIRRAAAEAQEALEAMVGDGSSLLLEDISGDKYYGRVLARVVLADGTDPADALLAEGLVDPYAGGRKAKHTCN